MRKILTIAQKQLYVTFRDRNLLLLMVGLPLAVSLMVGLAFGSSDSAVNIRDIPVAVVNLDEGVQQRGQQVNFGQVLTSLLVAGEVTDDTVGMTGPACSLVNSAASGSPATNVSLDELLDGTALDDVQAARAEVENGTYAAAVIIPADYSARLSVDPTSLVDVGEEASANAPAAVEVFANNGQPVFGSIVRSIVEGYTNQVLTGNIAVSSSINTLIADKPLAAVQLGMKADSDEVNAVLACAFSDDLKTVTVETQAVTVEDDTESLSLTAFLLVMIGSAQAAFMAMFTGMFGALEIYEERRQGTLQRMLVSPTLGSHILAGKLLGTFITVLFQLLSVLIALTLIGSIVEGRLVLIWGSNPLAIVAVLMALALAAAGVGILIGGVARSPEQATAIGPVITIVLSLIGGAFGVTFPETIAQFSLVFQGSNAFTKLSQGNGDIASNLVWLVAQGAILFGIGVFFFTRQFRKERA